MYIQVTTALKQKVKSQLIKKIEGTDGTKFLRTKATYSTNITKSLRTNKVRT